MTKPTLQETKLMEALTAILREIERCCDDSLQDIANEKLAEWETGLRVNIHFVVESIDS